jgi:hypothetical protein
MQLYDAMMRKCWKLAAAGKSWEEIMLLIPDEENYLLDNKRKTGVYDIQMHCESERQKRFSCDDTADTNALIIPPNPKKPRPVGDDGSDK